MISDIPDEGGGGSKKGKFLRTSFMDGPLHVKCTHLTLCERVALCLGPPGVVHVDKTTTVGGKGR